MEEQKKRRHPLMGQQDYNWMNTTGSNAYGYNPYGVDYTHQMAPLQQPATGVMPYNTTPNYTLPNYSLPNYTSPYNPNQFGTLPNTTLPNFTLPNTTMPNTLGPNTMGPSNTTPQLPIIVTPFNGNQFDNRQQGMQAPGATPNNFGVPGDTTNPKGPAEDSRVNVFAWKSIDPTVMQPIYKLMEALRNGKVAVDIIPTQSNNGKTTTLVITPSKNESRIAGVKQNVPGPDGKSQVFSMGHKKQANGIFKDLDEKQSQPVKVTYYRNTRPGTNKNTLQTFGDYVISFTTAESHADTVATYFDPQNTEYPMNTRPQAEPSAPAPPVGDQTPLPVPALPEASGGQQLGAASPLPDNFQGLPPLPGTDPVGNVGNLPQTKQAKTDATKRVMPAGMSGDFS
jgi:hypothetical protein